MKLGLYLCFATRKEVVVKGRDWALENGCVTIRWSAYISINEFEVVCSRVITSSSCDWPSDLSPFYSLSGSVFSTTHIIVLSSAPQLIHNMINPPDFQVSSLALRMNMN